MIQTNKQFCPGTSNFLFPIHIVPRVSVLFGDFGNKHLTSFPEYINFPTILIWNLNRKAKRNLIGPRYGVDV